MTAAPAFATPALAQADAEAAAPGSHMLGPVAQAYPEWVLRAEMSLAVLVRFPPLKPKLLERPPFAYVHDLLTSMHKRSELFEPPQSGTGSGTTGGEVVQSSAWSIHTLQSKVARTDFIARLLQHTETLLDRAVGVQPLDVVESRACEATVAWLCEVATLALARLRPKPISLGFSSASATPDIRTPAYSTFTTPARPPMVHSGFTGAAAGTMAASAATPLGLQSPWPAAARATTSTADASLATTGAQTPASASGLDAYAFAGGASSSSASSTSSLPPRKVASPRRSKHSRLPPPSPAESQAREAAATAAALTLLSSLQPERKASPVTVPVRRAYDFVMPASSAEPVAPVTQPAAAVAAPSQPQQPVPQQQSQQPRPPPLDPAALQEHEIAAHQHQQHQALQQQYSQPETISRRPTPSRSAMLTASLLERLSPPAAQAAQSPPVLGSGSSPFSRRTPVSRTPVLPPAASPLRPIPVPAAAAAAAVATRPSSVQATRPPSVQAQAVSSAHSSQHNSRPVTATPDSSAASSSAALLARAPSRPVDASLIRETRQLLRLFLPSACLPPDRVRAPAFPLLHEVLLRVMHETGFAESILPADQPELRNIAVIVDDIEAQTSVLQLLITYMELAAQSIGSKCLVSSPAQLFEGSQAQQLSHEFLQQLVNLSLDTRIDKPALLLRFQAAISDSSRDDTADAGEAKEADDAAAAAAAAASAEESSGEDDSFPSSACVPPYILSTRSLLAELIHASASNPSQTLFLESVLDPLLPLVGFEGFHRIVIMLKARSSFFNALWIEEADTLEFFYPPPSDFRIEEAVRLAYEARQFAFVQRVIRFLNLALQQVQQEEASGYAALTVDLDPALIVSAGSPLGPNPTPLHAEESDYGRQVHGLLQSVIQTAMTFDEREQEALLQAYERAYGALDDERGLEEERVEEAVAAGSAATEAEAVGQPASLSPSSFSSSSASVAPPSLALRKSSSRDQEEQERAVEAALQSRVAVGRVHPSSPSQTDMVAAALAKQIALSSLQHPAAAVSSGPSLLIPLCIFLLGVALIVGALWFGDASGSPELDAMIEAITGLIHRPPIELLQQARAKVESAVRSLL